MIRTGEQVVGLDGSLRRAATDGVFLGPASLQNVVLQARKCDELSAALADCEKAASPPPAPHVRSTLEAAGGAALFLAGVLVGVRAARR